eukprot:CAMPEP_0176128102 /NCGR_PEP_ID=MMETSP0120_2-20121206/64721_1 /TAXON_ID=160619 /ORGANISM="Kryptoperidinium foliaceum, Strain CCMP 1326" /LENGTH=63 /DNA_ID=CAMNT_0017463175 /DNA_START=1 /DNA_END=188 /DNA_ORIENTATION=+
MRWALLRDAHPVHLGRGGAATVARGGGTVTLNRYGDKAKVGAAVNSELPELLESSVWPAAGRG